MGFFKDLKSEGMEASRDVLGGFAPVETDIYQAVVKNLYAGESKGGAVSLTLLALLANGKEYKETFYVTNKKKENFFVKDGKKQPLPGFTTANDLCLIATGKELSQLNTEKKVVNIYNYEEKKEIPTSVEVVVDCLEKPVALGIVKQKVNKQEQAANGEYVATAEEKEENVIDKVFHPTLQITVAEARLLKEGETPVPAFWNSWLKKNKDQTRDRRTIKTGAGADAGGPPKPGAPAAPTGPRKSLFGK